MLVVARGIWLWTVRVPFFARGWLPNWLRGAAAARRTKSNNNEIHFVNCVHRGFVTGFGFDSNEMGLVRRTEKMRRICNDGNRNTHLSSQPPTRSVGYGGLHARGMAA